MVSSICGVGIGFITVFVAGNVSFFYGIFEDIGRVGSSKKLSTSVLFLVIEMLGFDFYVGLDTGFAGEAKRSSSKSKSSFFLVFTTTGAGFVYVFRLSFLNKINKKVLHSCGPRT